MTERPILVWYRNDLRLDDHPALRAAAETGAPVAAVFVLDPALDGRPLGAAARWWLHHSLEALAVDLGHLGVPLVLRHGPAADELTALAVACGAAAVHWNRGTTPFLRRIEDTTSAALNAAGVTTRFFASDLIAEPDRLRNGYGKPYQVFTPFWKALYRGHFPDTPVAPPARVRGVAEPLQGTSIGALGLLSGPPDHSEHLHRIWTPGERGAGVRFDTFLADKIERYPSERDSPAADVTSRLSPHLRFGELSMRRLWHAVYSLLGDRAEPFLRETGWREFHYHTLLREPTLHEEPLRPEFADFPWQPDETAFRAWTEGRTGYPIVDAGMRELAQTGWMHNRVRMIAASFLVKDLLIPWQWGESWFWDALVDADPANNPGNWQWVAGCGTDAAPYFRIFNPILQGEKFDPRGAYVRRWVPELEGLDDLAVHRAGEHGTASPATVYPPPMIEHRTARRRALQAYERITREKRGA